MEKNIVVQLLLVIGVLVGLYWFCSQNRGFHEKYGFRNPEEELRLLRSVNVPEAQIYKISHDEKWWYYLNKNTCVPYLFNATLYQQSIQNAITLREAINNNAFHVYRNCPFP